MATEKTFGISRKSFLGGSLALFAAACSAVACAAETVDLNGTWKLETFAQPDDGAVRSLPLPAGLAVKDYPATVPGCCEEAVMRAG